jgi:hypothetical protein
MERSALKFMYLISLILFQNRFFHLQLMQIDGCIGRLCKKNRQQLEAFVWFARRWGLKRSKGQSDGDQQWKEWIGNGGRIRGKG